MASSSSPASAAPVGDSGSPSPAKAGAYAAAMLLAAAGDALGYKNGEWEFCYDSEQLHRAVAKIGFENLRVCLPEFRVSDDTVMHMATARALIAAAATNDPERLFEQLAQEYCACMADMAGRSAGICTISSCEYLAKHGGYKIPFNEKAGGCGGAMRSMCIGMAYWQPHQLPKLVAASVEAGRITHNHPTGYLGSVASAFFASLAVQGRPLERWGYELLHTALPAAWKYVESSGRDVNENRVAWPYFSTAWADYLKTRGLLDGRGPAKFPSPYGVPERHAFYTSIAYSGWGGASGHDSPMIAYDALLGCGGDWRELCNRAVFHGGDNDSTGTIACCLRALMLGGLEGVPEQHYQDVEYSAELKDLGEQLARLADLL